MLKAYMYSDFFFFLNSRKKWVKHKLKTFFQIYLYYKIMLCQVNPVNQSLCKRM